jgi:hypothetical protein
MENNIMKQANLLVLIVAVQLTIMVLPNQVSSGENLRYQRKTPVVEVYEKTRDTGVNISGVRVVSTSAWSGYDWPAH